MSIHKVFVGNIPCMEALGETWKSGGVRHYSLCILLFCAETIARDSGNIEL